MKAKKERDKLNSTEKIVLNAIKKSNKKWLKKSDLCEKDLIIPARKMCKSTFWKCINKLNNKGFIDVKWYKKDNVSIRSKIFRIL